MLFAEITAEGWVIVIGAIGAMSLKIMEKFFDRWQMLQAAKKVTEKFESSAAEVKGELKQASAKRETHLIKQDVAIQSVKETVQEAKSETVEKLNKIHQLVNGEHGRALKLNAELSRQKADLTGDPSDEALAKVAADTYASFLKNMPVSDSQSQPNK